jgi:hypothetical protein
MGKYADHHFFCAINCSFSDYENIFRRKTKVFFDNTKLFSQGLVKSNQSNNDGICEEFGLHSHQMEYFITVVAVLDYSLFTYFSAMALAIAFSVSGSITLYPASLG